MTRQFWFGFGAAYAVSIGAFAVTVAWARIADWYYTRRCEAELRRELEGDWVTRVRLWEGQ